MGWAAPIVQGIGQYQAAQAEKAQYEFNAKSEMIAADQEDAKRRGDLLDTLSSIDAIRTAHGLDVASPTGLVLSQSVTNRAEDAIRTSRLNYVTKAQADRFGAWGAGQEGMYDLLGGFLKGYNELGQEAAQAAGGGGGGA